MVKKNFNNCLSYKFDLLLLLQVLLFSGQFFLPKLNQAHKYSLIKEYATN